MNSSPFHSISRRSFSLALAAPLVAAAPTRWILSAGTVLTMDKARRVLSDGAVAIEGNKIVEVGPRAEIEQRFRGARRVARPNSILIPGLINTHTHAAMSLLRGIADDKRLQDWLESYIFPAEAKNVSADFCYWGTLLACLEMSLGGTTTFTDMYYFEDDVARATRQAGMRGVLGQTVIGFPVADAKTPADALAQAEAFFKRCEKDPLIIPAIAPHALYTNTRETLQACRKLANQYKRPLLIHVSETKRENDDMRKQHSKSPTQTLAEWGIFDGTTVAAHCVWTDESDIATLAAKRVGIAHCPSSNMKLASGFAPVVPQLAAGIHVGLGTDGPAGSNNDFNLMEEMDLAAKLAKVHLMDPVALPATTALEMATLHGAQVIGMGDQLGALEAGRLADAVFVRTDVPNAVPSFDPYSTLVYASKAADVSDVFVNGQPIVREGKSLTLRSAEILAKARSYRQQISLSLKK
ncbi:amidohydrolase family protein [Bryobacter aggregatus]|uniref:amidohydrolase family protein n=1 Tax=Bryobacter aggregatus TaxID=360054 RepID=UPI001EE39643|nr:amidohydrolase [Bryobacter aggregatus]